MKKELRRFFELAGVAQESRAGKWYRAEEAKKMFEALNDIMECTDLLEIRKIAREAISTQDVLEDY